MHIPALGTVAEDDGMVALEATSDGRFAAGRDGVRAVVATGDRKVEFVAFADHTLAHVTSAMGFPAYYPVQPVELRAPVSAVLMDLDGTTVRSERFWVWIIERSVGSLLGNPRFRLEEADLPFVSGHSVSEHLAYCIAKYCPHATVEQAREHYFEHARRELHAIAQGRGKADAFVPAPGVKEFLLALKAAGIKVALVTSGLYEKAYPEILGAFRTLGMGDPRLFYDAVITAGFPLRHGEAGTLGELSPKPHPWLYADVCRVGLGIPGEQRHHVVGIEDSGAGVCSVRLAGYTAIGMAGGNIIESGTRALCTHYCSSFPEILSIIMQRQAAT
ncbi:HAD hydrolase-like protein [bacterium]|nr:HAD hydrolase-like protein [bacterium]